MITAMYRCDGKLIQHFSIRMSRLHKVGQLIVLAHKTYRVISSELIENVEHVGLEWTGDL